ncbi:unnamed protein product, partial [Eruca vesicaria subsp. sativa]|nr:unnamed protein product [Eruca vesicaria subsp. sativa]
GQAIVSLNSLLHILPQQTDFLYIVDAFWKSPEEQAGIGWSLISKEGIPRLHGSSAIEPISSSLVAEAMAMLIAEYVFVRWKQCCCCNNSKFELDFGWNRGWP